MIGRFSANRLARNAAHDVDAELESLAMHVIGERLNPTPFFADGKPILRRQQAAPGIHRELRALAIIETPRLRLIPLDVHDDVLPSVTRELRGHCVGVRFVCASVTVVAKKSQLFQPIGGVGANFQ